ncbi:UNVERIFIED_ORG: hypothetical protein GGE11_003259 [Mycolicibacterium obuense]
MPDTITITITEISGEPMLDSAAMALMFGVRTEEIQALPVIDGASPIPREWIKRGRRRTREAAARTGSNSFDDVIRYWARVDHNAELEVIYR